MSRHYKKLILLLIPACAGFCLSLALGSTEEPCELCQLCQNKALVKEAIFASGGNPSSSHLPEQFDPNYYMESTYDPTDNIPGPGLEGVFDGNGLFPDSLRFESIIAEGDMVAVLLEWEHHDLMWSAWYFQMVMYRIANGKIVRGWLSPVVEAHWQGF